MRAVIQPHQVEDKSPSQLNLIFDALVEVGSAGNPEQYPRLIRRPRGKYVAGLVYLD